MCEIKKDAQIIKEYFASVNRPRKKRKKKVKKVLSIYTGGE